MTDDDYKHFVCIVAGDNPEKLMEEYNKNKEIEPKIIYRYSDISKLRKTYINEYEKVLKNAVVNNSDYADYVKDVIEELKDMTDEEYYEELTTLHPDYYVDNETGDIMVNKNIEGKYSHYNLGKIFSCPLIKKDGNETFQCKKEEINWDAIHLSGGHVYERVWELVMEESKPLDEHEQKLYENMCGMTEYFNKFENKENYVASNTAFWGYAFLSESTGWMDGSDVEDQFEWMKNFYDVFIKNLPENTTITVYECKK